MAVRYIMHLLGGNKRRKNGDEAKKNVQMKGIYTEYIC